MNTRQRVRGGCAGNRYECERTGHDTGIVEAIVLCKDTCSPLNELLSGVVWVDNKGMIVWEQMIRNDKKRQSG